jgi:hypothetical protein
LRPAHLGQEEHGLGLTVRVRKHSAEPEALFEAGGSLGQPVLAPVCAGKSGQAVDLAPGVAQLAEDDAAVGKECRRLRQAVLEASQVAEAAQQ